MSQQIAEQFIEALHTLEETSDVEPLAGLYAPDGVAGNVLAPDRFRGPDGARQFWSEYRGTFQGLHSSFRNVVAADGRAALEWTTDGASFEGAPVRYSGVTLLEMDGPKITRSIAYFDPNALGHQILPKPST